MSRVVGAAHIPLLMQQSEMLAQAARTRAQIAAQKEMQQRAILADQVQQSQRMAFSALQQQQQATLQEARDARLNQYDLDRLDKVENARKAERTFEETGLTPDSIRQWAEHNSQLTGQPVSYDQAYSTLAGYKQQERVNQEMTAKLDYLDKVDANKLSRNEREVQKKINTLNDWESGIVNDPGSSEAVRKQTRDYAQRGRVQLLAGIKLPPREPTVEEWAQANTIPNSGGAIRIQKSDGSFDIRQIRNKETSGSDDYGPVAQTTLQAEVEAGRRLNPKYWYTDEKTGVRTFSGDLQTNPATAADLEAAERSIRFRLYKNKIMSQLEARGLSFADQEREFARMESEKEQQHRIQTAATEGKQGALADDNLAAQGLPKKYGISQPAPGGDETKVAELRAALNDPAVPESTKAKIRSALGG